MLRDLDAVEAEIRERSPGYAALTQPQPLRAAGIQALLDPRHAPPELLPGRGAELSLGGHRRTVESFELPGRAAHRGARPPGPRGAEPLRRRRTARPGGRDAAALGRLLLGPVAGRLGGERLVVVPDGALQYVPFGALPLPASVGASPVLLLERHEIVYLPSASALAVQRRVLARRPPAASGSRCWRIRSSTAGTRAWRPRRGASRTEIPRLRAPARLAPGGGGDRGARSAPGRPWWPGLRCRPPAGARRPAERLPDRPLRHPRRDRRRAPGALGAGALDGGRAGRPQEGFLHLHDIYNLRLDADLVVLSAAAARRSARRCAGEGLIGLTRGFQYAGAPRVVASLWRVEDRATAALMARFYRAMWVEGLPPGRGAARGPALGAPAAPVARSLLLGRLRPGRGLALRTGAMIAVPHPLSGLERMRRRKHEHQRRKFRRDWYIQWVTAREAWSAEGLDGSPSAPDSEHGDRQPFLTEEYAVCVGFAVLDDGRDQIRCRSSRPTNQRKASSRCCSCLAGEQLRWKGYYKQQPLYIYISAAET